MTRQEEPEPGADPGAPGDAIDELPVPYIEMDARGVVTRVNRATLALHPEGLGDLVGKPAFEFLAGDQREESSASYAALMQNGGNPPVIRRALFDRSGAYRTYELHRSLIRGEGGKPCGVRMVGIDVTETLQVVEDARQTRRWLESAMESVAEGVLLIDALGFIRCVNRGLEELLGWKARDLVGKVVERAMPVLNYHSGCPGTPCFNMALEKRMKGTATVLDREGRELKVEMTTAPIVDKESGSTTGVVAVLRPIE